MAIITKTTIPYEGRYLKLTVEETSYDLSTNKSNVSWKLESIGGKETSYTIYNWGVWINDIPIYNLQTTYSNRNIFPAIKGIKTGRVEIPHNPDGSIGEIKFRLSGSIFKNVQNNYDGILSLTQGSRGTSVIHKISNKTNNSVTIDWTTGNIADYIWYSIDNGSSWVAAGPTSLASGSYTITGLLPNKAYYIKTRARRSDTKTDNNYSETLIVTTNKEDSIISSILVDNILAHSCKVHCVSSNVDNTTMYEYTLCESDHTALETFSSSIDSHDFIDLKEETTYCIRCRVKSRDSGQWSNYFYSETFKTPQDTTKKEEEKEEEEESPTSSSSDYSTDENFVENLTEEEQAAVIGIQNIETGTIEELEEKRQQHIQNQNDGPQTRETTVNQNITGGVPPMPGSGQQNNQSVVQPGSQNIASQTPTAQSFNTTGDTQSTPQEAGDLVLSTDISLRSNSTPGPGSQVMPSGTSGSIDATATSSDENSQEEATRITITEEEDDTLNQDEDKKRLPPHRQPQAVPPKELPKTPVQGGTGAGTPEVPPAESKDAAPQGESRYATPEDIAGKGGKRQPRGKVRSPKLATTVIGKDGKTKQKFKKMPKKVRYATMDQNGKWQKGKLKKAKEKQEEEKKKKEVQTKIKGIVATITTVITTVVVTLLLIGAIFIIAIPFIKLLIDDDLDSLGAHSATAGYYPIECEDVTVIFTDKANNYATTGSGTYTLEDYVAGVVTAEVGQFNDIEVFKEFAITARTYFLLQGDISSCSIESSDRKQVFSENILDLAKQAAEETKGQVLLDNDNNLILTEYDAFCSIAKDDNYYTIKQKNQKIPVSWVDSHSGILPQWKQGKCAENHGRGASQWGSYYLATEKNYDYKQLLAYYYSTDESPVTTSSGSFTESVANLDVKETRNAQYSLNRPIASYLQSQGSSLEDYNNFIRMNVQKAGVGTREAVVTAAVSLINYLYDNFNAKLPYYWGGQYQAYGIPTTFGQNIPSSVSSGGHVYQYVSMDCSGFVSWALKNAGYNISRQTTWTFNALFSKDSCNILNESCIGQAGDILNSETSHVKLIVAVDKANNRYYVAESTTSGIIIQTQGLHTPMHNYEPTKVLRMDSFYNNKSNVDPNY